MSIKIVEKNSFREKVKENDKLQIENIIKFLDNILFIIDYKFLGKKGLRYAFENFDYIATPSFERVNIVITLFKEEIINIEEHRQEIVNGNFRFENVHIKGIEEPIKLDISFVQKSDKLDYSSDEALRDRLTSIKKQHPEEYNLVLANIIEAKRILKEGEIYKKQQGGIGGIGIENWILQNGGSLQDTANSFIEASKGKSLKEFKKAYPIWDFGENHYADEKNSILMIISLQN